MNTLSRSKKKKEKEKGVTSFLTLTSDLKAIAGIFLCNLYIMGNCCATYERAWSKYEKEVRIEGRRPVLNISP